jgi:hypothetical protein
VRKSFAASLCAMALSVGVAGCAGGDSANTTNTANANMTSGATNMPATTTNTPAAGMTAATPMDATAGAEIVTTEENGVRTQTRTFSNGRVERVVVTTNTKTNKRTAKVYSGGQVRDLPESKIDQALSATGDAIADSAGFVADKAGDVARPVGDKAADVGRGVADKAEDVGRGVADKAEDVGRPVVKGAKKVGEKTVSGAKKVGGAVKDAVTP